MFDYNFIKNLYTYKYPEICTDWDIYNIDQNICISNYGLLLRKFSRGYDLFNTAKEINRLLHIEISDEEAESLTTVGKVYDFLKNK